MGDERYYALKRMEELGLLEHTKTSKESSSSLDSSKKDIQKKNTK